MPNAVINAADNQLEAASTSCERWGLGGAGVVVAAVIAELVIAWIEPPYISFLADSAIADAAIAVGITVEVVLGTMWNNHIQTELRKRSNTRLEGAIKETGIANARASVSLATAAASNAAAAQANKRAEELRADNLSLQASMRPRRFTFTGWVINPERITSLYEGLKAHAGTVVLIQAVPDFEATLFARDVAETLARQGWKAALVTQEQSHVPDTNFIEGTWIVPLNEVVEAAAGALWGGLIHALHEIGMPNDTPTMVAPLTKDSRPLAPIPKFDGISDAIFVRIGLKSSTGFVEMQRREMVRQLEDADNNLIAHVRAGGKLMAPATDGSMVETKIGQNGKLVSADPTKTLWERDDPTLILGNEMMLRSTPPRDAQAKPPTK